MRLKLPDIVTRDALRKAVALFFAVLIWFAVDAELHETLVLRNVPVEIEYDPGVIILSDEPPTVDVTLRGSRERLNDVSSSDIEITARIPSDIQAGVYFYGLGLSPRNNVRRTPPGIRVTDIQPNRIEVAIDRLVTRPNIPVRAQFEGELKEGYRVVRTQVIPSTVTLQGPHRRLLDIDQVETEPVLLDDTVVQDFSVKAQLVPIPGVTMIDEVRVEVTISRHSRPKTLHGLAMSLLQSPDSNLQLDEPLPQATVTVRGPKAELEALTELSIVPFVDISGITSPGRYRREVKVWLQAGESVTADAPIPGWVDISLVAAPASQTETQPEVQNQTPAETPVP